MLHSQECFFGWIPLLDAGTGPECALYELTPFLMNFFFMHTVAFSTMHPYEGEYLPCTLISTNMFSENIDKDY